MEQMAVGALMLIAFGLGVVVANWRLGMQIDWLRESASQLTKDAAKWRRRCAKLRRAIRLGDTWKLK